MALVDASGAASLALENIAETEGGHAANVALENIVETEGGHAEQDGDLNGESSEANCTNESEGEAEGSGIYDEDGESEHARHGAEEEPDSVSEPSSHSTSHRETSVSHILEEKVVNIELELERMPSVACQPRTTR